MILVFLGCNLACSMRYEVLFACLKRNSLLCKTHRYELQCNVVFVDLCESVKERERVVERGSIERHKLDQRVG